MCLDIDHSIHKHPECLPLRNPKAIRVYKVLALRQNADSYGRPMSPFLSMSYELNTHYYSELGVYTYTDGNKYVELGLHAYTTLEKAQKIAETLNQRNNRLGFDRDAQVYDAIVPEGSHFYWGYDDDIVATCLIVMKKTLV